MKMKITTRDFLKSIVGSIVATKAAPVSGPVAPIASAVKTTEIITHNWGASCNVGTFSIAIRRPTSLVF